MLQNLIEKILPAISQVSTFATHGELAQLVERLHGMQEVSGSTPLFSTSFKPPKGGFFHAHFYWSFSYKFSDCNIT